MTDPLPEEEIFCVTDEQLDELLALVRKMDLPPLAINYTTFIHPDAQKDPTK